MSGFQAAVTIWEQQHGVAMQLPEAAQQIQRRLRERNETILVALSIADMNALPVRVDIAHLQTQAFAESQT